MRCELNSCIFYQIIAINKKEPLILWHQLTTDREEANDLLQETSLKALDNEDKYTPDTNFKGWMYTIMRNSLRHFFRYDGVESDGF